MTVLKEKYWKKSNELYQLYYVLHNRKKIDIALKQHPRDVLKKWWIKKNNLPKNQLKHYSDSIDEILYWK